MTHETSALKDLTPAERFELLTDCRRELTRRLSDLRPPISVLLSGSALYGFAGSCHGNLDDLDCNAIIPDGMTDGEFVGHLRRGPGRRGLFVADEIDEVPSAQILGDLLSGSFDILRVAARIGRVSVRLHVIRSSVLARGVHSVGSPVRMLLPNDPRYLEDTYLQSVVGFPLFVDPKLTTRPYGSDGRRMILDDYVFRDWTRSLPDTHFALPPERRSGATQPFVDVYPSLRTLFAGRESGEQGPVLLKGVLGDRLLMAEVLNEAEEAPTTPTLDALWRDFMIRSLRQNPEATDGDILASFSRASRFSPVFIEAFTKRISDQRRAVTTLP